MGFFRVGFDGAESGFGAGDSKLLRMSQAVVKSQGASGEFFLEKSLRKFFEFCIFGEYMIGKITNTNAKEKNEGQEKSSQCRLFKFGKFKGHESSSRMLLRFYYLIGNAGELCYYEKRAEKSGETEFYTDIKGEYEKMSELYDLAILGAGPAGICAAIYAGRAKLNTLWLDKNFIQGGQIADTYEVDNYPGMPGISGVDLGEAMAEHAAKLGIRPFREKVLSVGKEAGEVMIRTKKHEYRAKTLILALGAGHRQLNIPGEADFSGMGVSYCATCDGAFFKDQVTAVIGGGNVAVEDAIFLSRLCQKVYLIHRRDELRAEKGLQESLFACENVEIIWDSVPVEISGENQVQSLEIRNVKTDEQKILELGGVFIAVGITPNTGLVENLVALDEGGYIVAGEEGITSVPGIFAAGDIRTKALRQVVTAVSDGANAVKSAEHYLMTQKME